MSKITTDAEMYRLSDLMTFEHLPVGLLVIALQHENSQLGEAICKYRNVVAGNLIKNNDIVGRSIGEVLDREHLTQDDFPMEIFFAASEKWGLLHLSKTTGGFMITISDITILKNEAFQADARINKLQLSNQDLEHFAYVASHDLQEPLRKVVSFGERLEVKAKDILQPDHQVYLERMVSAARRMQRLIDHLLEYSKVTRSQDDYQTVDLNKVIKKVLDYLQVQISQKSAVVNIAELPVVDGIEIQLSTLFQNLLSNSVKFTNDTTRPVINIDVFDPGDELLTETGLNKHLKYIGITIADNGIGFQEKQADMIFALFSRLRGRSEYEGAGLGLAICKRVVENHYGAIFASAIPEAGAVFTIILPLNLNK